MSTTQLHPATETQVATDVLARLEAAWNAGDGQAFGTLYADDATFVTIRGDHLRGRAAIAGGHAAILGSIYAGSTNRMEVLDARRVADDVIVMTSRNTLDAPHGPLAGVHAAMSTSVLVHTGDAWQITVTHNTLEATR
ncbi:SgcJ/EcaC family oxidoreductase [Terrabacter sp. MAHUQ-38]|uniref:SgcJ/EcaC family oxidoreductase n=1 Tax=unclassified Terrabacter TaxID=2630222 RepID=UPI00165D857C|nr:SgcJ/EcaC family oxidoreductase [Terrabacter sp. MAHUQ-38]MBC9822583.1 SgcJ/EcaC family oxidoreductase [Terrabacter sp. MAHUQ-38]